MPGLAFIKALKPVTYNLDITGLENYMHKNIADAADKTAITEREKIIFSGFVAQDVERTAKQMGYDFSGVDAPKNDKDLYSLRYADFVVPLVKAVQELSAENESLKSRLEKIEQALALNNKQKTSAATKIEVSAASLQQNAPNPFNQRTVINYYLPQNTGKAFINITHMNGTLIKTVAATATGKGQLVLQAGELAAGIYQYSLVANGKLIDTKKMVLIK